VFGIPLQLIHIEASTVLIVILSILGALYSIFVLTNYIAMFWPDNLAIQQKTERIFLIVLVPIWHLINFGWNNSDWPMYVTVLIYMLIFEIFWPIFVYSKNKQIKERFIADEIAEGGPRGRTLLGRLYIAKGSHIRILLLLLILGGYFSYESGKAKALNTKEVLVLNEIDSKIAVVRISPGLIIGVPINQGQILDKHSIIIRNIGENSILKLNRENVRMSSD
jgi:hypothetical protein